MAKKYFLPSLGFVFLLHLLAAGGAGAASGAIPRFETAEIALLANQAFDARQGEPNPFTEIELTADVTSPSGKVYKVDGFFDGDGQGGAAGKVFKLRVFADEAGTWTWRTSSNRPDLHGRTGSFACSGTLPGVFSTGPVVVDPERPRRFRQREGGPVFLLGKFLDEAAPPPLQYSHTMFSEELTDADREALLARHLGMGLNKINVYLANKGDYGAVSTTPWVGTAARNDKERFDLGRWHLYERWVRRMRDAGFVAQLWFFADDSGFGDLPEEDRKRLIHYGMARLSGYANTMFTLALEWQEGWTVTEVTEHLRYLHHHNPWDRLASAHGLTGPWELPDSPWTDYIDLQAGNEVAADTVYSLGLSQRQLAEKPLIQEEHGLGSEDLAHRRKSWAALASGAAGLGTGGFLKPLSRFTGAVPVERLEPAPALVVSGEAWAMADPGRLYVAYLAGGEVRLDLAGLTGRLTAEWFDPRQGTFQEGSEMQGGAVRSVSPPEDGDWVLLLYAAPPARPAPLHTIPPCRAIDTRDGTGIAAAPWPSGERRRLTVPARCGIPTSARALVANLTAVAPTGPGHIILWPAGRPRPQTSKLNFSVGQTRANSMVLPLDGGGLVAEPMVVGGGSVHLVLDVSGYFE